MRNNTVISQKETIIVCEEWREKTSVAVIVTDANKQR